MMFITDKALIQNNQIVSRGGSYSPTFFTNIGLNTSTITASNDGVIFTNLITLTANQTKSITENYLYFKVVGDNPNIYLHSVVDWWKSVGSTATVDLSEIEQKISSLTQLLDDKATPEQINQAIATLIAGAGTDNDTFKEIEDKLAVTATKTDISNLNSSLIDLNSKAILKVEQTLSTDEKQTVIANIGAATSANLTNTNGQVNLIKANYVNTAEQVYTDAQKIQARSNIGAMGSSEISTKVDNTLTITAGNGLTGGGNLSSNRSIALGTPTSITATSTNAVTSTSHSHAITTASTSVAGVVKLNDTVTSASVTEALTANQGRLLNDKITKTQTDVSNISVGGRNLLIGTEKNIIESSGNSNTVTIYYQFSPNVDVETIEDFTLSCEIDLKNGQFQSGTTNGRIGVEVQLIYTDNSADYKNVWFTDLATSKTVKQKLKLTSSVNKDKTIRGIKGTIQVRNVSSTSVKVYNVKLEKGNIATDWTPAIEDINDTALASISNTLPVGSLISVYTYFNSPKFPEGCLMCNGALVSRTTYANLFNKIGTQFGAGDGSTTFKLPNRSSEFTAANPLLYCIKF